MSGQGADDYLRLRTALAGFKRTPAELSGDERQVLEAQVARASALERKVLSHAAARDVHVPPPVVEEAVKTIAARYPDESEFLADLARNGLDAQSLRTALERELKVEAVIDKVSAAHSEVSEDEAAIYYFQHRDRFLRPELRTVRQILITVNDAYAENRRAQALQRLQTIRDQLAAAPHTFEAMARRHSECPSAMEGGRVGKVKRGMLYPELDEVLFALEPDAISDVVESELGLHLLWCEAVEEAGVVPFDEVRDKIAAALTERKKKQFLREWLKHG